MSYRHLYNACVRPILTYASQIWWPRHPTQSKITNLERVQRKGLRKFCAAFRTTPIYAMEIDSATLPVRVHLEGIVAREEGLSKAKSIHGDAICESAVAAGKHKEKAPL